MPQAVTITHIIALPINNALRDLMFCRAHVPVLTDIVTGMRNREGGHTCGKGRVGRGLGDWTTSL